MKKKSVTENVMLFFDTLNINTKRCLMGNMSKEINDYTLVKNLNKDAVLLCYDMFKNGGINFNYINRRNVRAVDLAEKMRRYGSCISDFSWYANNIKLVLENNIRTEPNSKAAKYKEKGIKLCEAIIDEEISFDTLLDVTKIFLCLVRECDLSDKTMKSYVISDIDFSVSKDDIAVVEQFANLKISANTRGIKNISKLIKPKYAYFGGSDYSIFVTSFCNLMQIEGQFSLSESE